MTCKICNDTGWYGDNNPGIRGNREYCRCECKEDGQHKEEVSIMVKNFSKEANKKYDCDFDVTVGGELWNIHQRYNQPSGEPAWYIGSIYRQGTRFERTFTPSEIKVPPVKRAERIKGGENDL